MPGRSGQGRPLGLMVAWLRQGYVALGQPSHKDVFVGALPSKEERMDAREWLYALPGGRAFSETFERPRRAGEDEEPNCMR